MKRYLIVLVSSVLMLGVLGSSAQATPTVPVYGGTAAQRATIQSMLSTQPQLLEYVQSVFPGFYVRLNYGGHAWPGYMDINKTYTGVKFTYLVAHEFGHMVQLAGDRPGGPPSIGDKWLALLSEHGFPESTWVWHVKAPYYGRNNPWENFAENVARAYFAPYYTGRTTPNTNLDWFSRAEMKAFLQSVEVVK